MKPTFLLILLSLAVTAAAAQQKQQVVKDSLPVKMNITNTTATRKSKTTKSPEIEITEKLNNLVSAYCNSSNTQATWTQIKGEAQTILLTYFRNGILMGTKAEEAFIVKMGTETMTQTDNANHKMILHAGIATVKPAEFKIIIIEKICK